MQQLENFRNNAIADGLNESAIVSIANQEGKIIYVNDKFVKISGYSRDELIGSDHRIVNSGTHSKEKFRQMWEMISKGIYWQGDICNRKKDGSLYWVNTSIVQNQDQHGNIQYLSIRFDITDQKTFEGKLRENEQLFSAVLQNLPVAVFGKDIKKDFQWSIWNKKAEELFGIAAVDCIGKYDKDFFNAEQASFFRAKDIETCNSFDEVEINEESAQTHKGEVILHTKKIVIRDDNGEPRVLLGITQDITKQKQDLETLKFERAKSQLSAERLEAIFKYSLNAMLLFNEFGICQECNLAAMKILGITEKEQWFNQSILRFSPEFQLNGKRSDEMVQEISEKVMLKGTLQFEWSFARFDKSEFVAEVSITKIIIGNEIIFFSVCKDLTELKQREIQDIHNSKLISMGVMSAGIAHEINNPLAIISGSLNMLEKNMDNPEKVLKLIEVIKKSTERICKIVKGLKKYSRNSSTAEYKNHNLSEIVKEALILTEIKAKNENVSVIFQPECDYVIHCDEIEIEQVLINLINNSIDAIRGCENKWVRIEMRDQQNECVLKVIDSGPGVPEELKNSIFDPFFTTKEVGQGTGLGLSITKAILEKHDAKIFLANDGINTCFEIHFKRVELIKAA